MAEARNAKEVKVTIRRAGIIQEVHTARSKDIAIAPLETAKKKHYRALMNQARQLLPDQSKRDARRNDSLRAKACRMAMDENISLNEALDRVQESCSFSGRRGVQQPEGPRRRSENSKLPETPQWARQLMHPQKLSRTELDAALQRVKSIVASHHREGRSYLVGERILEKLTKEMIRRKSASGYTRIVQGGLPGLGKHKR